jgi:plastocyanin
VKARWLAGALRGASAAGVALGIALFLPGSLHDVPPGPPLPVVTSESDYLPTIRVRAYEYGFEPENLVIKTGYPVSWRAVGEDRHLVTPSDKGARWIFYRAARLGNARHKFDRPGVYHYYCSLHPKMRGTVTVRNRLGGSG